jgi:hypothetical protein
MNRDWAKDLEIAAAATPGPWSAEWQKRAVEVGSSGQDNKD